MMFAFLRCIILFGSWVSHTPEHPQAKVHLPKKKQLKQVVYLVYLLIQFFD